MCSERDRLSRRQVMGRAGQGLAGLAAAGALAPTTPVASAAEPAGQKRGAQRLSIEALQKWESLNYGMFIHFGMSTFVGKEIPDGKAPASTYAPDRLDVDQWISVARDAGMRYAVLTSKHVAGHCLWPSKLTNHTVANSGNRTDVVEQFVKACEKRGVKPGFYYCSWDNHNRFGSRTPTDRGFRLLMDEPDFTRRPETAPGDSNEPGHAYTTSAYQSFQTAQIMELLTQYGPIMEIWIDIPGVLGRGYRTFLYDRIAEQSPETVIVTNSGIDTGENYPFGYAWPSDIITIEKRLPPESGHRKWRSFEGKEYCLPGEVCDTIGQFWFFLPTDPPRPDDELASMFEACRARGVNFLLNVPPDTHGLIPDDDVKSLQRLRKRMSL